MVLTRIRSAGAALFAVACLLLSGTGRADEKAPPPKPVVTPEQARKEFEASLAGRSVEELTAFVEQLAQEWPARKGGYEVAHARFTARTGEATKARQQLGDLKPPPPAPLGLRADTEAASKAAQARVDFHAARVRNLEAVRAALVATGTTAAEFERAASAADEHVFKTRTAAAAATKAGASKLPDAVAAKQLDADAARIKALVSEVRTAADKAKSDLTPLDKELTDARAASDAARAQLDALKGAQADAVAALKFEKQAAGMTPAQLADEFTKLRKQLAEKVAAIDGDARDYKKAAAAAADARAAFEAVKEPLPPGGAEPFAPGAPLDQTARTLAFAQQLLASWLRGADELEERAKALVAALDEAEKRAVAYATTLDDCRRTTGQLALLAAELARRVGRGDLAPDKAFDTGGLTDRPLDADTGAVNLALAELRRERDALRKPDPDSENTKALVRQLLAQVTERIALLGELKKLAADYAVARKDRPDAELKRLDQRAAERMNKDAAQWDWVLALDRSQPSADASELLAAYYKELVDSDDRAENLKRQKEALESLVELTKREAADVAKLRTILEKQVASSEGARKWDAWLRARLAPTGLKAEANAYQDEVARLNAVAGANARRVEALTGNPPEPSKITEQSKLAVSGGEIGRARNELQTARVRGLGTTGIKIGIILLAALIVPRVLLFILGRAIRGGKDEAGSPSPVLGALRGVLKAGTWIAAAALILSTLGYDVTALVVALAIGALAVALAARPMIADVLGAVVIFAERRFKVGDVVRLGTGDPARVVGITWRSTALKNPNGLVVSVPNRKVTEVTVENLSRGGETYDALAVTVSTDKDAGKVINVIRGAVGQCKNVSPDNGVTVVKFHQKGNVKVVEYRFWWFLKDYEARNKTRDEVFARIALGLAHEDMTGIEVTLG